MSCAWLARPCVGSGPQLSRLADAIARTLTQRRMGQQAKQERDAQDDKQQVKHVEMSHNSGFLI